MRFLLITLIIFHAITKGYSQEGRALMLGLNPSLSVEQYYNEGEFDINVFPLSIQLSMNRHIDLRFISMVNIGIRNDQRGFANIGIESAMPIYFKVKEDRSIPSKGFYAAPVLSIAGNKLDENTHFGCWIEPGYQLGINERFNMIVGLQTGATYITYNSGEADLVYHFGLKVILGWWMNQHIKK